MISVIASSLGSCCNNDLTSSTLLCFIASSSGEDSITVLYISLSDSVYNNYIAAHLYPHLILVCYPITKIGSQI